MGLGLSAKKVNGETTAVLPEEQCACIETGDWGPPDRPSTHTRPLPPSEGGGPVTGCEETSGPSVGIAWPTGGPAVGIGGPTGGPAVGIAGPNGPFSGRAA